MPAERHPAYREEKERLEYTLKYVDKELESSINQKSRIDKEITKGKRHFDSSSSESYIGLMVNTMLYDRLSTRVNNLKKARSSPYFARIDFKEEGKKAPEKLYIGKMVLIRDYDQELIIVDWRAPIANLYYEARLGKASYESPDGRVDGELSLKRQFSIHDGKLDEIFDIDITTNDEFLQKYLGANAENRLKDIVSTIQVEQNRIIRADMWKPLIVQGAAGSGKTTIALHRIAYLIYTFEKRFNPDNFMIIAPNRLFLNYISTVLPDLGVENVKQTTFQDFAMELIGKKFKLKDPNEKLVSFVNYNTTPDEIKKNVIYRKESEFKSSFLFKNILDQYIKIIEENYIPEEDFKIGDYTIFKYEDLRDLFYKEYKKLPLMKRVNEIKKHLLSGIKRKKEAVIEKLNRDCDITVSTLKAIMEESEERRKLIVDAIDKKNDMIDSLEKLSKNAVKEYIAKISKADPYKYYEDLIMNKQLFNSLLKGMVDDEFIEPIRKHTEEILKSGYIEIEDLAPIIYIKLGIYGVDEKIPVKHIVIDEAQDFSVFQIYVIKNIIKDSSFTMLGDLCQGIHSYRGINSWEDVMKYVFDEGQCNLLTLEQSYRTTVEIMNAANRVLINSGSFNLPLGKPVIRHGESVQICKCETLKDIACSIMQKIDELKSKNYKSIAVICKTMDECKKMYSYLKKGGDAPCIITGSEKEYKGGTVIVPSYLSKGLEFDAVIISNGSSDVYKNDDLDAKLLYVSMTRPLHSLYIYYTGEISQLLRDVGE